ncbi:MAG: restriction endonuclease [Pseudomonadota bacterium]
MQLKMRENSLFAILLRSSWLYSVAIAGVIILLGQMLFRGEYAAYGVAVALPLLVIAAVSAYRQSRKPGKRLLEQMDTWVRTARAREISAALTSGYQQQGYQVTPYKGKAAELRLEKDGYSRLVCCKRIKAATTPVEPIRALVDAGESQDAVAIIFISLGDLSAEAAALAAEEGVDLMGREELAGLVQEAVRQSV